MPAPQTKQIIPIKVGWFGPQGAGKTTSAALLALALSREVYGGAPVYVTDTEPGWQFLMHLFQIEGVELIQRTEPTFQAMCENLREAETIGACVWNVDTLTIIWAELMQSFKEKNRGFIPIDKWGDIREMWNKQYVATFLNTAMCCQALGRIGNVTEEIQDEQNPEKTKLVKVGTRFKAGGGEDFGYEPHLLLEVSLERKARTKAGSKLEGEGRMVHRVDVMKDRTWALNGKVIRWSDKPGYQKGGYRQVWEAIKPHFDAVQRTARHVQIKTGTSSGALIPDSGESTYHRNRRRRDVLVEELDAAMQLLWGGNGQAEKRIRMLVGEAIFGVRSKSALEQLDLWQVERGVKILKAFEQRVKAEGMPTGEQGILNLLEIDIRDFDEGKAAEQELPF